jgi:hypothetical protein
VKTYRWVVPALIGATFLGLLHYLAFSPLLPAIATDLNVEIGQLGQMPAAIGLLAAAERRANWTGRDDDAARRGVQSGRSDRRGNRRAAVGCDGLRHGRRQQRRLWAAGGRTRVVVS